MLGKQHILFLRIPEPLFSGTFGLSLWLFWVCMCILCFNKYIYIYIQYIHYIYRYYVCFIIWIQCATLPRFHLWPPRFHEKDHLFPTQTSRSWCGKSPKVSTKKSRAFAWQNMFFRFSHRNTPGMAGHGDVNVNVFVCCWGLSPPKKGWSLVKGWLGC